MKTGPHLEGSFWNSIGTLFQNGSSRVGAPPKFEDGEGRVNQSMELVPLAVAMSLYWSEP